MSSGNHRRGGTQRELCGLAELAELAGNVAAGAVEISQVPVRRGGGTWGHPVSGGYFAKRAWFKNRWTTMLTINPRVIAQVHFKCEVKV